MNEIHQYLAAPSDETLDILRRSPSLFWVDWRECDEAVVEYCEARLQTGCLTTETVPADNELGYELYICFKDKRVQVQFDMEDVTRDSVLIALSGILAPDYQIRFPEDFVGSDTLAFVAMKTSEWEQLEQEFGANHVAYYFSPITSDKQMFALSMKDMFAIIEKRKNHDISR